MWVSFPSPLRLFPSGAGWRQVVGGEVVAVYRGDGIGTRKVNDGPREERVEVSIIMDVDRRVSDHNTQTHTHIGPKKNVQRK